LIKTLNSKMQVALTLAMLCAAFAPQMVLSQTTLRWCAVEGKVDDDGMTEFAKCEQMLPSLNSQNTELSWSCTERNDCHSAALQDGNAEVVSLDGGDLFATSLLWGAVPVLAEDYNEIASDTGGTTYHTVVAMKASKCTDTTTLSSLKDMRACSTGYRKTAGWRMPVGTLLKKGIMKKVDNHCDVNNDAESAAEFFSGMCSPGAAELDVVGTNKAIGDKLCNACKQNQGKDDFCVKSKDDYQGYNGALKCMVEESGDVAFIKHTTFDGYTFTGDDKAENYRLLCPQGGCMATTDFLKCKWATVPAHAVVVNPSMVGRTVQALIREVFAAVQLTEEFEALNLFSNSKNAGTKVNPKDLVFKGSSWRLVGIDSDMVTYMGDSYGQYESLAAIEDNNSCLTDGVNKEELQDLVNQAAASTGGGDDGIPDWGIGIIVVISIVCAGMLGLILAMWSRERKGKPMFQPLIMENPLAGGLQTLNGQGKSDF